MQAQGEPLPKYTQKVNGHFEKTTDKFTLLFLSLGAGSKDADIVTNELLAHDFLALNGEHLMIHVLDNWSGNRNRCVALGYLQYHVDIGVTTFNMHLMRWPNDSKDRSDG